MASLPRPNILWISLEDTSPRFGCYGDTVARTPNIDRLAAGGCVYSKCFSTAPVCAPARAAVITGMYAAFIGAQHMRTGHNKPATPELPTPYECVPPAYVKLVPEYLRAAGYYCTNNFKTDYQFQPPQSGWDEHSREAHWRNRPDPDQPFFAVFNREVTHESRMWDESFKEPLVTDPDQVVVPPYLPDTPRVRVAIARQYDNITNNDAWVGQLLDELDAAGLTENTVVMLWSDHGEGLPRAKRWPYDTGIRVPMIVRWPGHVEAGATTDQLVSTLDLGPTVLRIAGLNPPTHMQGQAFLGDRAQPREHIFATRDRYDESYDHVRAVRDSRFKYVRNAYTARDRLIWNQYRDQHPATQEIWRLERLDKLNDAQRWLFKPMPAEELYDTEADPWELHNLAEDPAHDTTRRRLAGVLEQWSARYDRFGDIDEAQMVRQWRLLNGEQPTTALPRVMVVDETHVKTEPVAESPARRVAPILIQLYCATQGASIEYTLDVGDTPRWRLYTGAIRLTQPGDYRLRYRACRIGFKNSEVGDLELIVG